MIRKLVVAACFVVLALWVIDWLGLNKENQSAVSDEVRSRAAVQYAEAEKINQEVRRQNEMDDGIAINVGARVITNDGITAAEKIGSFFSNIGLMVCLVPWGVLGVLYIIWRFSRPVVRRADDNGYDYE